MNEKTTKIYHAFHDWIYARCWFSKNHISETNTLLNDFNSYMDQSGLELCASVRLFEQLLISSYFKKFEADDGTYWRGIATNKRKKRGM